MSEDIYDEYPSLTLAKETPDQNIEPLRLGQRIKDIRSKLGITLEEASQRTGLARSTLSKIENEQISPTFQAMQKLAMGLQIDMPQLFEPPRKKVATGRRDLTKAGQGKPHPTPTYEHELLATELSNKKMMPFKSRVRARAFEEYNDWVRHDGEEFLMVISGDIMFYSEFYEPIPMSEGDSMYYDANMGHMLISTSTEDALILWVTAK
ncbi:helix-turn-helix domain-containing protein [Vibrio fortis]|jgi:transcriptional regulator with XRE-family HTH domain|uniref:Helix-turn-helix domain-containing protein n=1 Tax=Vibrio fortis TaxID=212667 RepID=A0A066UJN4_9VIBR|nr:MULTISPECIES: XRE family transcriptional regulator [Vibrio]KAB0289353.1 helix-turn-helix domain-containing protein [Vibrio fortis]KAB0300780.1 helix-turn-helix domain-containing protein [Vibrio fortis]KDN27250.1 transcriptional regulator [Vibrio fortis]MCG9630070.1 XRE family transcriptional regulator [Vibrio sp. Isolate30]MDK9760874.1 XRE family transcriptional regulator [Vibrio sp. D420a]|tara:strand:+ start:509 stop:1132 length:624 start_codon:yes stop_codon:yes gene_type:complete